MKILGIIGLVLVVLSLVWLFLIFPAIAKLPSDYYKEVNFEGTYKVMNAETQSLDEIPVNVKRVQEATSTKDNVLIINQDITASHAIAGIELPQFGLSEVLGIDRSTREYIPGYGDMDRSGQFCFPSSVEKQSYSMWIPSAGRSLEAKFTGEEDFHKLKVLTFKINEQGLDIGTQQGTGLSQVLDVIVNMKVEPVSGTTVLSESINTIKVVPAPGMEMPVYISNLIFNDETISDLVDTAKDARTQIMWLTVYGFWVVIGIGIILILLGLIAFVRAR
jgi:hypothetical protein